MHELRLGDRAARPPGIPDGVLSLGSAVLRKYLSGNAELLLRAGPQGADGKPTEVRLPIVIIGGGQARNGRDTTSPPPADAARPLDPGALSPVNTAAAGAAADRAYEAHRTLVTVLFTDIVGSTEQAIGLGDQRWLDLVAAHDRVLARELERFQGRLVRTSGDGAVATFDGATRAVRCARAISEATSRLGIQIRAGLHTGECWSDGANLQGVAVHISARIAALAGPGEVLVSSTVRDVLTGSDVAFVEHGVHQLKGVPGAWPVYAEAGTATPPPRTIRARGCVHAPDARA